MASICSAINLLGSIFELKVSKKFSQSHRISQLVGLSFLVIVPFVYETLSFADMHYLSDTNCFLIGLIDLYVSMNEMENLLSNFPHLKYLTVQTKATMGLANGSRWQNATKSLIWLSFFLQFDAYYTLALQQSLHLFRSSFWLEEKRWYVTLAANSLFCEPQFAFVQSTTPHPQPTIHSTEPHITDVYNQITKIFVDAVPSNKNVYFANIKVLVYRCLIPFDVLSSFLDPQQVEHLIVWSIDDVLTFLPLDQTMSRLNNLTIAHTLRTGNMEQMTKCQWKQIRKLKINIDNDPFENIPDEFVDLFPCLQELIIFMSSCPTNELIVRIIDRFEHVSSISFFTNSAIQKWDDQSNHNQQSIIRLSHRLTKENFTCRSYKSWKNDSFFGIHWWIGEKVS